MPCDERSPPADMVWLGRYGSWDVDHAGWMVTLHSLEEQTFYEKTLQASPALGTWRRFRYDG
jgi:hypothetical protein